MLFEPKKEFSTSVEKRNAIGMWTKKFLVFKDGVVFLFDSEKDKSASIAKFIVTSAVRLPSEDRLAVEFKGKRDDLMLRFADIPTADAWYDLVTSALTAKRNPKSTTSKVSPTTGQQLPLVDPRFGLRFVEVPAPYATKFANLDKSVLYWFSPVKKFGSPSKFTKRMSTDDRVGFCGDKAFYLTKESSEVTRCIKISKIKRVCTNVGDDGAVLTAGDEPFIVLQLAPPEYDLCFSAVTCAVLLRCLESIFASLSGGVPLNVLRIKTLAEAELQLERPSNFSMTMVLPSTKEHLKRALDDYAKKHGITFSDAPGNHAARTSETGSVNGSIGGPSSTAAGGGGTRGGSPPAPTTASTGGSSSEYSTNPMYCFLTSIGCEAYFMLFYGQNVDLDIIECMDETDLRTYGVSNAGHIAKILSSVQDPSVMQRVQAEVDAARTGWASSPKKAPAVATSPSQPPAAASPPPPQLTTTTMAPTAVRPVISLDSDDDDLDVVQRTPSSSAAQQQFQVVLDDSDDDLDVVLPPAAAAPPPQRTQPPIVLDDDDI